MQDQSTSFQGIRPPTAGTAQFPAPDQQHIKCPRCDSTNTKFCYYNNYNLSQPRHFCKSCRRYWTKGGALRNIPVGGGTRKNSKRSGSSSSSNSGGRGGSSNCNYSSSPSIGSGGSNVPKRPNTSGTAAPVPTQIPAAAPARPTTLSQLSFAPAPTLHLTKPELLPPMYPSAADPERQLLDIGGSFSSLLTSAGHFGGLIDTATFHHTVAGPGSMTLPVTGDLGGHIGGSRLELLGPGNGDENENPPQPQNPVAGTSTAADQNFLGIHGVSGCWDSDGGHDGGVSGGGTGAGAGWPGLSIYTPGSSFR